MKKKFFLTILISGLLLLIGSLFVFTEKTYASLGYSDVGWIEDDGSFTVYGKYLTPEEAWQAAVTANDLNGIPMVIRLTNNWNVSQEMQLALAAENITVDLNGYAIMRTHANPEKNGGIFRISGGATLNIKDSRPQNENLSKNLTFSNGVGGFQVNGIAGLLPGSKADYKGGGLEDGRNSNGGGLITVTGGATLNMTGGTLYDAYSSNDGGAIKVDGGKVNLDGTTIQNCHSEQDSSSDDNGGAIFVTGGGEVSLKNCTISNCTATDHGGAIHVTGNASLTMENTTLASCTAQNKRGGAIFQDGGSIRMTGCNINYCKAENNDGGAIFHNKGTLYCNTCEFYENSSKANGGAVHVNTGDPTWLLGCSFYNNKCGNNGGAIYESNVYLYLEDCTISGNQSTHQGGGVYVRSGGSIDLCGKTKILYNTGENNFNNLVLNDSARLFDQGLSEGAAVSVRNTRGGTQDLSSSDGKYFISQYQVDNYFQTDSGSLKLRNTKEVSTGLVASAFTNGKAAIIAGMVVIILMVVALIAFNIFKKKGEQA